MRICTALLIFLVLVFEVKCEETNIEDVEVEEPEKDSRAKRFLGLFSVVQFTNSICNSSDSSADQGICYTSNECVTLGGRATVSCAAGFGVCCVFVNTCADRESSAELVTFFQNEAFPEGSEAPLMCMFSVSIANPDICQLRLDFQEFDLDPGSDPLSPCDRDRLELLTGGVMSSGTSVGPLCGVNTGQHIYLPVDQATGGAATPPLRIIASARTDELTEEYKFSVKMTQIDCTSTAMEAMRAPENCVQYVTQRQGTIISFNWSAGGPRRAYPINQDYSICFRRSAGDCQLKLVRSVAAIAMTTSVGQASDFDDDICGPENGCGAGECLMKAGNPDQFRSDRLEIHALYQHKMGTMEFKRAGFFCGVGLGDDDGNTAGTDLGLGVRVRGSGPFMLRFVTDELLPDAPTNPTDDLPDELGFSLDFTLETSCTPDFEEVPATS